MHASRQAGGVLFFVMLALATIVVVSDAVRGTNQSPRAEPEVLRTVHHPASDTDRASIGTVGDRLGGDELTPGELAKLAAALDARGRVGLAQEVE